MTLNITFLGHAGFVLSDGKNAIAIDPFLTGNPVAKHAPRDIKVSAILLTHGHDDHVGDTVEIARANNATVFAPFELAEFLRDKKGVASVEDGNPGGRIMAPFGWVAFTPAIHSSTYSGAPMGNPAGLMIHFAGRTIYHTGDTAIFSDMKLLAEFYKPDIAMLPIGDRYTMGPELASLAAEMIKPKAAIPMHYNTWPPIAVDVSKFNPKGVPVQIISPGETWTCTV